jgi:hypothetical protein
LAPDPRIARPAWTDDSSKKVLFGTWRQIQRPTADPTPDPRIARHCLLICYYVCYYKLQTLSHFILLETKKDRFWRVKNNCESNGHFLVLLQETDINLFLKTTQLLTSYSPKEHPFYNVPFIN